MAESFSIHSPLAGRDAASWARYCADQFFNPLAPCGARPKALESHMMQGNFQSTRPLRGETESGMARFYVVNVFQSTRPLRGETLALIILLIASQIFQSTRPLRGETDYEAAVSLMDWFSIHSPLAGRDFCNTIYIQLSRAFQSTRPLRGETFAFAANETC